MHVSVTLTDGATPDVLFDYCCATCISVDACLTACPCQSRHQRTQARCLPSCQLVVEFDLFQSWFMEQPVYHLSMPCQSLV